MTCVLCGGATTASLRARGITLEWEASPPPIHPTELGLLLHPNSACSVYLVNLKMLAQFKADNFKNHSQIQNSGKPSKTI